MRAAVVTVSSSKARGGGADESGPLLAGFAERLGLELAGAEIVPDDREQITACLRRWCDDARCELVLTTGGTGFSPTDVTPEATNALIEREAPGVAEAMRAASREHTRHWMLSRATAGIRGRTLIVNFPGSPRSIEQTVPALEEALPHALALLSGAPSAHS